jgi:phosphate transport system substrate-binding protein
MMTGHRTWPLVAALAVVAAGCSSTAFSPTPDVEALRAAIAADFPAVDGSTSAHPLARMLACDLLGAECEWSAPASANVERTYVPTAGVPEQTAQQILGMKHSGTHGAYVNLIDGKADVILVARAPSSDELTEAESKGVVLDVRPAALDAFVFLVNAENSVESMDLATLRDIYAGKITTWRGAGVEMADSSALIHAYQRERNSGSQELMMSLVMKETEVIDAPDMIVKTMLGPFNAIGGNEATGQPGDELGLGYSVYFYAAVMFDQPQVKRIAVDGVKPDSQTITSRTYPLVAEVYVVTRQGTPAESTAIKYRDWLLTPDGQRAVKLSGYVELPEA